MRFAIGEFAHETNTFCPGFTELDAFKSTFWYEGDGIIAKNRGVRNDLGGMIAAGERLGIELAPTLATTTQPSATVSRHPCSPACPTCVALVIALPPRVVDAARVRLALDDMGWRLRRP